MTLQLHLVETSKGGHLLIFNVDARIRFWATSGQQSSTIGYSNLITRCNSTHLKEVTSIVVLRVSTSSHYLQQKIEIDHHESTNICHNVKSSHQ